MRHDRDAGRPRSPWLLPEYAQAVYDAALDTDDGGTRSLEWIETDNHVQLYDQVPYVSRAVELTLECLDAHTRATS